MLTDPPCPDLGVWAICGVPDIHTTIETSQQGFTGLKGFNLLAGFGGNVRSDTIGEYDYIDFDVNYQLDPTIPETFVGVSGGGLWHVILQHDSDGNIKPHEYHLSGLAFFETPIHDTSRSIRCHGIRSIYTGVYQFVSRNR